MSEFQEGDNAASYNFGLQIDGVLVEYIKGIDGLVMEQDVIENPSNTADGIAKVTVMPGMKKNGQVTVKRGLTESAAFTEWINQSIAGQMSAARKNATIIAMDWSNNPVKRYNLRNAWCSRVETSSMEAGENSPLTETVTIVFEEMDIES